MRKPKFAGGVKKSVFHARMLFLYIQVTLKVTYLLIISECMIFKVSYGVTCDTKIFVVFVIFFSPKSLNLSWTNYFHFSSCHKSYKGAL